ncbi:MAG: hypothetical protein ACRD44_01100, partial [Bryobacteraceae bacterium]
MEWCVHIAGPPDLDGEPALARFATLETSGKLHDSVRRAAESVAAAFGDVRFSRCAFGNEFCEHLTPEPGAVAAAAGAAAARGMGFTLLTPYVSDAGLARLRAIFNILDDAEVVF